MGFRRLRTWSVGSVLLLAATASAGAQEASERARGGSQFLIPLGSVLLPGLGQYLHGAPLPGFAFTAIALGGYGLGATSDGPALGVDDLPRSGEDQLAFEGLHVAVTAGALSAYDAFGRGLPALRRGGRYTFLTTDEDVGALLTAPFDFRFVGRWTTWIDLGYTAVIAGLILATREPGADYEPFRSRDAAFITALSLNAGVGEEALFRGWLMPLFHQTFGQRFWLANGLQGGLFGAGHLPQAEAFAIAITGWALYEGWLVRRNGWSIRESIFHHFWYDVLVGTATLLTDERAAVQVRLPTIRF